MERSAKSILATGKWSRVGLWSLGGFLLVMFIIGFWVSREPEVFWVNRSADPESAVVGFSTVDTLIRVAETLLNKNGGYITNDKMPPMLILDNIPSWELGVINQMRDLGRVMRDDYTRSQSQSKEDEDVAIGAPQFLQFKKPSCFQIPAARLSDGTFSTTQKWERPSARRGVLSSPCSTLRSPLPGPGQRAIRLS